MAQTKEAHYAQIDAWQKENIKRVVVKLNKKTEQDIIDHLATKESVQGYIKEIIRKDME